MIPDIQRESNLRIFLKFCFGCTIRIVIASAVLIYYGFGILLLVEDYENTFGCGTGNIWAYCLVSLLQLCIHVKPPRLHFENQGSSQLIKAIFLRFFLLSGMAVWGGLAIFQDPNCASNTDLYTFAFVSLAMQCTLGLFYVMLLIHHLYTLPPSPGRAPRLTVVV